MTEQMVEVILYEDGRYEVNDVAERYATTHLYRCAHGVEGEMYYCKKSRWKFYLLKLVRSIEKSLDKQIAELNEKRNKIASLKIELMNESGGDVN